MNRTPARIIFVGVATEDAIALVDRYPAADERVLAADVLFAGGGPAATAAVAAARLGVDVALVASVGEDDAGAKVIGDLAREGVDVSGVMTIPGQRTARSVVVISGTDKQRAISNLAGPQIRLGGNDVAHELIASADWVHVDQHGWGAVREHLDGMPRPPRLSVDAGNVITDYRQRVTALYAPTKAALIARYGKSGEHDHDVEELLRRAVADGAESAVATSGAEGSFAVAGDGPLIHVPVPSSPILSTLGGGDVFHGALLAGLVHLEDGTMSGGLSKALAYATVVASLSCCGIDGRSQIPGHQRAMKIVAEMTADERKKEES